MAFVEEGHASKQFACSDGKKNVFLIGDSIRMGYCEATREDLADVAEVFYVADNCRNTQYVIPRLLAWSNMFSDPAKVDLVQFNCGHWDAAHWYGGDLPLTSEVEYGRNIQIIIRMLGQLFPNAKLVFATTTPMNPSGQVGINPRTDEQILRYNRIAAEVAEKNGVPVNDLFAVAQSWDSSCYRDYCHFTPETAKQLGKIVAARLRTYL